MLNSSYRSGQFNCFGQSAQEPGRIGKILLVFDKIQEQPNFLVGMLKLAFALTSSNQTLALH